MGQLEEEEEEKEVLDAMMSSCKGLAQLFAVITVLPSLHVVVEVRV